MGCEAEAWKAEHRPSRNGDACLCPLPSRTLTYKEKRHWEAHTSLTHTPTVNSLFHFTPRVALGTHRPLSPSQACVPLACNKNELSAQQ